MLPQNRRVIYTHLLFWVNAHYRFWLPTNQLTIFNLHSSKIQTFTHMQGRQTSQCTCTACFLASKYPKMSGLEASKSQNTLKFQASKPPALPVFSLDWHPWPAHVKCDDNFYVVPVLSSSLIWGNFTLLSKKWGEMEL